jgi:hypothetical protein
MKNLLLTLATGLMVIFVSCQKESLLMTEANSDLMSSDRDGGRHHGHNLHPHDTLNGHCDSLHVDSLHIHHFDSLHIHHIDSLGHVPHDSTHVPHDTIGGGPHGGGHGGGGHGGGHGHHGHGG